MNTAEMTVKIAHGKGFVAALDQSGGSTPKALRGYGIESGTWSTEAEMYGLIHQMRSRILTSPSFTGDKVIGTILFERTMDDRINGKTVPAVLHERGVVPFIKIDKGLEDEAKGVRRMKSIPLLEALLVRAKALGVFGTKARSVIHGANREGIAAVVAQQFAVGKQVLAQGLMPIIEPEINIHSVDRASCDQLLLEEIWKTLDALPTDTKVMLKLSLPARAGLYDPLVDHPRVLRIVALSGGFARPQACAELAKNRGLIASFSRALLEDLRFQMSDVEFDAALGSAIDEIYTASTEKVALSRQ